MSQINLEKRCRYFQFKMYITTDISLLEGVVGMDVPEEAHRNFLLLPAVPEVVGTSGDGRFSFERRSVIAFSKNKAVGLKIGCLSILPALGYSVLWRKSPDPPGTSKRCT